MPRIRVKFDSELEIPIGTPTKDENGIILGKVVEPLPEAEPLGPGEVDIEISEEYLANIGIGESSFGEISFSGRVEYES